MKINIRFLQVLFCLTMCSAVAAATPADEIESLLHYIGNLEGATFIRNGDVHTPKEAEEHLRMKWTKQKGEIATAEDFIRLCGTKSSMSGKPYIVRFKDGREEEAAAVLSTQLREIRESSQPKSEDRTSRGKADPRS